MAKNRVDTEAVVNLVINGKQALATQKDIETAQRKLNAEFSKMKAVDPGYAKAKSDLQLLNKVISEHKKEMRGANDEAKEFKTNWLEISKGVLGANVFESALNWVQGAIQKVVNSYAEVQKARAILTTAFKGDADMANDSLKMLLDFAAKTPYSMQEATDSFIKLVNRGIIPTKREMTNIGDIAASQGKSMDQLVEAILDAQTGENERLKEFGIRASKNGDMVTFSFKGITKEVKNTEEAIKNAILSFGEMEGVKGVMETVSKSIVGLRSNIEDTEQQIYTKIGQRSEGIIFSFYNTYAKLLGYVNEELLASESLGQRMTKQFGDQTLEVNRLEKSVVPLLDRYDQLNMIAVKNSSEQAEVKKIIKEIADVIPEAVTRWDEYGNALDINAQKARDFVNSQRAMLIVQNKQVVDQLQQEIKEYTTTRDNLLRQLRDGTVYESASGGVGGASTYIRKMTTEEYNNTRKLLTKYNDLIKLNKDAIAGFNGDYLKTLTETQKEEEKVSKARTEGVIEKEIKALQELRAEQDVHSKSYAEYTAKIKKLQLELADAQGKSTPASKAAEKLKKEEEKLADVVKRMQADFEVKDNTGLEKKLAEISKKYDPVIEKAKKLKDQVQLGLLETMKNGEIKLAEDALNKESTAKIQESNDKAFKTGTDYLNDQFSEGKNFINSDYASGLKDVNSESGQLALKEQAQQRERELTEEHLLAMKLMYETYGKDSTDIDSQLTQIRIQNAEREAQSKIAATEAKRTIDQAYLESSVEAVGVLKGLVNQQSFAYKGLIIADKALAIAKIIMNTQAEISGYYAKYALVPGGVAIASSLAAAAKIRSGISIGLVAATGVGELVKSSGGGNSKAEGSSHASGITNAPAGMALVGEKGDELINEGGRWWITNGAQLANLPAGADVYSADETQKMLRNKTLGQRIYPPVNYIVDSTGIAAAERAYRSQGYGYSFNNTSSTVNSPAVQPQSAPVNFGGVEKKLDDVVDAIKTGFVFDYKGFEDFKAKIDSARDSQSA